MASSSLSWKSEVPAAIELLVLFHLGPECADLQSEASKTCSVPSLSHTEASCKLTSTTSLLMKEKIISPSWLPKIRYERERIRLYPWKTIIIRSSFSSFFVGREPTTWPAINFLQITVCSCVIPSKCVFAVTVAANNLVLMRNSNHSNQPQSCVKNDRFGR